MSAEKDASNPEPNFAELLKYMRGERSSNRAAYSALQLLKYILASKGSFPHHKGTTNLQDRRKPWPLRIAISGMKSTQLLATSAVLNYSLLLTLIAECLEVTKVQVVLLRSCLGVLFAAHDAIWFVAGDKAPEKRNGRINGSTDGTALFGTGSPFLDQLQVDMATISLAMSAHAEKLWQELMRTLTTIHSMVRLHSTLLCTGFLQSLMIQ